MNVEGLLRRTRTRRILPSPDECRRLRTSLALTQEEVAQLVGVAPESISRYEGGTRRPRGVIAERYARLLDRLGREVDGAV
jgi:transcriptional regulator with XRE-family HTH domain